MTIPTDALRQIAEHSAYPESQAIAAELLACREERESQRFILSGLRALLVRCGRAVGVKMADEVSTDFLGYVPAEVERVVARLHEDRDAARAEAEQARRDGQEQTAGLHEKLAEVRAEAEKLRDEVTQLEGMERQRDEAYATLDDVCKALGADVDSAVAQALMFKEKAGELAAVKRQRDELVAAVLPVLEKIEPKPSPFQPLLLALVAAVKAAEQPNPQGEGGGA